MQYIKKKIKKLLSRRKPEREVDPDICEDGRALRREMYEKYTSELRASQLSNSQQYDKAILTLSSAGFAVSVTAFELAISSDYEQFTNIIVISWWLFFAAIASSIISFVVGNKAISQQIKFANDYFIQCYKDAGPKTSRLVLVNSLLNLLAGISFLAAIAMTINFFTKIA